MVSKRFLVDTSILVSVFRDASGARAERLLAEIADGEIVIARPVEMELLAGAKDDAEWNALRTFIDNKSIVDMTPATWQGAARLFFELRRQGMTIRKLMDCCLAQIAIENALIILHNDRDFDQIATAHPLKHVRLDPRNV